MLSVPPGIFIKSRRGKHKRKPTPAPAALTLVAASVDDTPVVTLQFDRAIDISSMDISTITVNDGAMGFTYTGFGDPVLLDATTVQVGLSGADDYDGPTLLSVGSGNGIVAVGGGSWDGVSELGLPFP